MTYRIVLMDVVEATARMHRCVNVNQVGSAVAQQHHVTPICVVNIIHCALVAQQVHALNVKWDHI